MWVLFSTVTGGWDNGAQLNCTQLIYFYLGKQIGCAASEAGLNLETLQKGPQREAARKETAIYQTLSITSTVIGILSCYTAPFRQHDFLLKGSLLAPLRIHKAYISKVIRGLNEEKINNG